MKHSRTLTCLAVATGLVVAGCAPDAQEETPSAATTATPSATSTPTTDSASASGEPTGSAPAPGDAAEDQPAPAAPADPLATFRSTPQGAPYAEIVTRVQTVDGQGSGTVVHRITADVNDRAVAVEVCDAYRTAVQTGPDRVEVVDTVEQLLAFAPGGSEPCRIQPPADVGAVPFPQKFTYDEALAAWRSGMPYYDAFCINYDPVTEAGLSQCRGIENGTVDAVTGEYIGG
ncbi:hypothetical protein ACH9EU_04995 [Kocuria sp. M1R5S2]|uniref:hypothetical protein n=1 Tax=Kocuria rhizosphaerae TaxID=3376285 RepID=UPI0037993E80